MTTIDHQYQSLVLSLLNRGLSVNTSMIEATDPHNGKALGMWELIEVWASEQVWDDVRNKIVDVVLFRTQAMQPTFGRTAEQVLGSRIDLIKRGWRTVELAMAGKDCSGR